MRLYKRGNDWWSPGPETSARSTKCTTAQAAQVLVS